VTRFQSEYYLLIIVNCSGHLHRVTTLMTLNVMLNPMEGNKEHETSIYFILKPVCGLVLIVDGSNFSWELAV